jgi:hypothetical protein
LDSIGETVDGSHDQPISPGGLACGLDAMKKNGSMLLEAMIWCALVILFSAAFEKKFITADRGFQEALRMQRRDFLPRCPSGDQC